MDFALSTLFSPTTGYCCGSTTALDSGLWLAIFSILLIAPVAQRSRQRIFLGTPVKEQQRDNIKDDELFSNRNSSKVSRKKLLEVVEFSDDDTVSTVSSTSVEEDEDEEEEGRLSLSSCSSSSSNSSLSSYQPRNVTFASPLVTAVYHRPACTEDDKYYLHYSEHDYIDFKLEYLTQGNSPLVRKTPRKVGFVRDVVTSTHVVLGRQERKQLKLYYNEVELQRFLDDFVSSLQKHSSF
jgi:hypothetical protein